MNFKLWFENSFDHDFIYNGSHFKTGKPVAFEYLKNTQKSPFLGSTFQQDIEPHGNYIIKKETDKVEKPWTSGTINFQNPLIIPFNSSYEGGYDESSWKAELSRRFDGKTGRELSKAIKKAGYDGIVTFRIDADGNPVNSSLKS